MQKVGKKWVKCGLNVGGFDKARNGVIWGAGLESGRFCKEKGAVARHLRRLPKQEVPRGIDYFSSPERLRETTCLVAPYYFGILSSQALSITVSQFLLLAIAMKTYIITPTPTSCCGRARSAISLSRTPIQASTTKPPTTTKFTPSTQPKTSKARLAL